MTCDTFFLLVRAQCSEWEQELPARRLPFVLSTVRICNLRRVAAGFEGTVVGFSLTATGGGVKSCISVLYVSQTVCAVLLRMQGRLRFGCAVCIVV